jgi:hypothetical protein
MSYGKVAKLERDHNGDLPWYAWPGGYPMLYLDSNNQVLCPECATRALDDPEEYNDWKPETWFIYYEGLPEFCSDCNREVESAYGDPEEEND